MPERCVLLDLATVAVAGGSRRRAVPDAVVARFDPAEVRRRIEEQRRPGGDQASYRHGGLRQTARQPLVTEADAFARLSSVETDLRRGTWLDPAAGKVTLGGWGTRRPESRTGL